MSPYRLQRSIITACVSSVCIWLIFPWIRRLTGIISKVRRSDVFLGFVYFYSLWASNLYVCVSKLDQHYFIYLVAASFGSEPLSEKTPVTLSSNLICLPVGNIMRSVIRYCNYIFRIYPTWHDEQSIFGITLILSIGHCTTWFKS